jgi:hypothetical protein
MLSVENGSELKPIDNGRNKNLTLQNQTELKENGMYKNFQEPETETTRTYNRSELQPHRHRFFLIKKANSVERKNVP